MSRFKGENRPVIGARLADMLVRNGKPIIENLRTLTKGLRRGKDATEHIIFEHPHIHELGLTVIGAVVMLTYAHLAHHLGLPPTSEVILAAGVSGTGNKIDFGGGIIARRYDDGSGSITVPDGSIILRKMEKEETAFFFRKPIRADKERIKDITNRINNLNRQTERARVGAERGAILEQIIELQNERDRLQ